MEPAASVLVVDDEPAIRALVAKIIERAGLLVDTACDGAEAIEMVDKQAYSVLVLDLNMPNMSGMDVIDHLKRRNGAPKPAIIVISASDSVILRQLDGSMVHSIIRKPFDIDVLGDLVSAAARTIAAADECDGESDVESDVIPFPSNG